MHKTTVENPTKSPTIAAFTGSFDPITNGHTDLILRASRLFDRILVAVGPNRAKKTLFSREERVTMTQQVIAALSDEATETATQPVKATIEVVTYDGLTVDFAADHQVDIFIRGIRNAVDMSYEYPIAWANHNLQPDTDTLFLTPAKEHLGTSSTIVREIASYQGDVSAYVHPIVNQAIQAKFCEKE